jgi:hypothetical protein
MAMTSWIPYDTGEYDIEAAFLWVPSGHGLGVSDVVVEVYDDNRGQRQLRGYGQVVNTMLVDLLDCGRDVDLVLDFAPGHRYRLPAPLIRAGKIFTPGVRSAFHFQPRSAWVALPDADYDKLLQDTVFLTPD